MKHRIRHRLTLVQDIELPPELAGKDLEDFLFAERKRMAQQVIHHLNLDNAGFSHKLRSVTPGRGFELLM